MPVELNDSVWITLMYELQSFVRHSLEQPEIKAELRQWMAPAITGKCSPNTRVNADEVVRAFELIGPGLMADFLAANPEILNAAALKNWAGVREGLHDATVDMRV